MTSDFSSSVLPFLVPHSDLRFKALIVAFGAMVWASDIHHESCHNPSQTTMQEDGPDTVS